MKKNLETTFQNVTPYFMQNYFLPWHTNWANKNSYFWNRFEKQKKLDKFNTIRNKMEIILNSNYISFWRVIKQQFINFQKISTITISLKEEGFNK